MSAATIMTLAVPTEQEAAARDLAPGSNRRGVLSQLDWRFLVGDDGRGDVLLLGTPQPSVLETLAASGRRVVIAMSEAIAPSANVRGSLGSVETVHVGDTGNLPLQSGAFGLVVACSSFRDRPRWSDRLVGELTRVLRLRGAAYVEGRTIETARLAGLWSRRGFSATRFWLVRRGGELRAAIPTDDVAVLGPLFFADVLYGRSRVGRALSSVATWLARCRVLHHLVPTRALVLRRGAAAPRPFDHFVTLGRQHGVDLARHHAALLARGSYDSNKVAVYFVDSAKKAADVIVKVTRTPTFNHRLEAENEALQRLRRSPAVSAETYPTPMFLDTLGGLTVLAQGVVAGTPFRVRTTRQPDCPVAADAMAWITHLGATSVILVPPSELATRAASLLDRLTSVYKLSAREREFLADRVCALERTTASVPMVFRHGDAGTWNVLVTPTGRAAFLDWEAAEAAGPPLWDLLDFIRSFGTWIGRANGKRDVTTIYENAFLAAGSLADIQRSAVEHYCHEVGVPRELVEPLFYTCWMQRAVREAAWATGPLERGTYIRLLRLCIRGRGSEGLAWLSD